MKKEHVQIAIVLAVVLAVVFFVSMVSQDQEEFAEPTLMTQCEAAIRRVQELAVARWEADRDYWDAKQEYRYAARLVREIIGAEPEQVEPEGIQCAYWAGGGVSVEYPTEDAWREAERLQQLGREYEESKTADSNDGLCCIKED